MAGYKPFDSVEDRREVSGSRKPAWPTRAQKRMECLFTSTLQKHEGKAATKPSPKLQNFGHRGRCEQIYHAPGVEGWSAGKPLQDAASPGAYGQSCGHEGPKCREILQGVGDGTLPNLVFTGEKKFDVQQVVSQQNDQAWTSSSSTDGRVVTRRQNPQSVIVWAAVTETGRSPLLSMITQSWIHRKVPSFISKEIWPARSPDLNPVNLSIRAILETKACSPPNCGGS